MSINRVPNYKAVETVTKAGKQLMPGAATETQLWKRPEVAMAEVGIASFKQAVEASPDSRSAETAKVIWRLATLAKSDY